VAPPAICRLATPEASSHRDMGIRLRPAKGRNDQKCADKVNMPVAATPTRYMPMKN